MQSQMPTADQPDTGCLACLLPVGHTTLCSGTAAFLGQTCISPRAVRTSPRRPEQALVHTTTFLKPGVLKVSRLSWDRAWDRHHAAPGEKMGTQPGGRQHENGDLENAWDAEKGDYLHFWKCFPESS